MSHDVDMRAAAAMHRGALSPEESMLADDQVGAAREAIEGWLYEHLAIAGRARLRMDAAKSWSHEYHQDFVARDRAIAQASRHYNQLRLLGPVDPLLEQMAITEGVKR